MSGKVSERTAVSRSLAETTERLRIILTDDKVQQGLKALLEKEIEFHSYLLSLEDQEVPGERGKTFGRKVEEKLGISWKDWIKEIVKKLNSLAFKLISPTP